MYQNNTISISQNNLDKSDNKKAHENFKIINKNIIQIKMTSEYGRQIKSPVLSKALTQGRRIPNKKAVSEIHTSQNQTDYEQLVKLPAQSLKKSSFQNQSQKKHKTERQASKNINSIKVNQQIKSPKLNSNRYTPKNPQISSQRLKDETKKNLNEQPNFSKFTQDLNIKQQNESGRLNENEYKIINKQIDNKTQNPRSKFSLNFTERPDSRQDQRFLKKYSQIKSKNLQSQKFNSNRQKKKSQSVNSILNGSNSIKSSAFFEPDERTVNQNPSYIHQSTETSKVIETEIPLSIVKGYGDESRINSKRNEQQQKIKKNLESFRVEFKKIEQIYEEKRLQQEAKNFIQRLKREKRQFEGKIYLIKRNQQQKRKMKFYTQIQNKEEEQRKQKYMRLKDASKNIQLFKQKSVEREKQMRKIQRSKSFNSQISRINKKLNQLKTIQQPNPIPLESNILGKRYLRQNGRVKKRVRTQSTDYPSDLTRQQRQQLDKIRQKIDQLTKSFRV